MKKSSIRKQLEKEIKLIKAQNNPFLNALLEATNFQKLVNLWRKSEKENIL